MRWNDDAPFTFAIENDPQMVVGIYADLASKVLKKLDCKVRWYKQPWARALKALEDGNVDMVGGAFDVEERRRYAHYSSVPLYSENVLFVRRTASDEWKFETLQELGQSKFKLGAQINVSYGKTYDRLIQQPDFRKNVIFVANRSSLWEMLNLGRIDGVIADEVTGKIELKKIGLHDAVIATSLVVSKEPAYFVFSKETTNKGFVALFDQEMAKLINSGVYQKIMETYLD